MLTLNIKASCIIVHCCLGRLVTQEWLSGSCKNSLNCVVKMLFRPVWDPRFFFCLDNYGILDLIIIFSTCKFQCVLFKIQERRHHYKSGSKKESKAA